MRAFTGLQLRHGQRLYIIYYGLPATGYSTVLYVWAIFCVQRARAHRDATFRFVIEVKAVSVARSTAAAARNSQMTLAHLLTKQGSSTTTYR